MTALFVGAWAILRTPVPEIDSPTADRLSATIDRWCEQFPNSVVPPEEWTEEVKQLRPHSVRVTPDGVYIERGSCFVESWGVFVHRTGSELRLSGGTDPSYRLLRGRVYWYEVKG